MSKTHEIVVVKPKPSSAELIRLTAEYFNAQGVTYDSFDHSVSKRQEFTQAVNTRIASYLREDADIKSILSVACGTGRREQEIETLTGKPLDFLGVELSPEMAGVAVKREMKIVQGAWPDVDIGKTVFDAAFVLSALGHVPRVSERILFLQKIGTHLRKKGALFFDVLNIDDVDEWGPEVRKVFEEEELEKHGFELGDVMYRKIGSPEVSYYHYFSLSEVEELLSKAGFEMKEICYLGYGKHYGQETDADHGAMLVRAEKV